MLAALGGGRDRSTLAFGFDPGLERPDWLAGRDEVAVRIPDHDFLRALLERTGALVVTSANPHGAPTPRTAQDVAAGLGPAVDLVVDGGPLQRRALHAGQRARARGGGRARGGDRRGPRSARALAGAP